MINCKQFNIDKCCYSCENNHPTVCVLSSYVKGIKDCIDGNRSISDKRYDEKERVMFYFKNLIKQLPSESGCYKAIVDYFYPQYSSMLNHMLLLK